MRMKVRQFEVKNQFIIEGDDGYDYFQSYDSIIVKRGHNKVILDTKYWDYSKTTGKYRNLFLNETKKETEDKINSGLYTLENFN
jgi:hypothetical protein